MNVCQGGVECGRWNLCSTPRQPAALRPRRASAMPAVIAAKRAQATVSMRAPRGMSVRPFVSDCIADLGAPVVPRPQVGYVPPYLDSDGLERVLQQPDFA